MLGAILVCSLGDISVAVNDSDEPVQLLGRLVLHALRFAVVPRLDDRVVSVEEWCAMVHDPPVHEQDVVSRRTLTLPGLQLLQSSAARDLIDKSRDTHGDRLELQRDALLIPVTASELHVHQMLRL